MIVYHTTSLGLDSNTTFSLDIEFVKDLLVSSWGNGARKLEQPVAECTFAMIDVSDLFQRK